MDTLSTSKPEVKDDKTKPPFKLSQGKAVSLRKELLAVGVEVWDPLRGEAEDVILTLVSLDHS